MITSTGGCRLEPGVSKLSSCIARTACVTGNEARETTGAPLVECIRRPFGTGGAQSIDHSLYFAQL